MSSQPIISTETFGRLADGTPVERHTLRNGHGMEARIINYGGTLTALTAPDSAGEYADVVLGYQTIDQYISCRNYLGALIGRYCNRIAGASFVLNGQRYELSRNDGANALHGGRQGFDKVLWETASSKVIAQGSQLTLTHRSEDGAQGYPGTVDVTACYTLTEDDALHLDFAATTDADTVINLTGHSYFNLRGKGDVLRHQLQVNASCFTPVNEQLIPSGELRAVAGTPFDFRRSRAIGEHIDAADEQLTFGCGYDHNWAIDGSSGKLARHALVYEPDSGRVLEVLSDQPGLQFYSGNFLDGSSVGKGGRAYTRRSGFCLEAQHFPDSPNQPDFPSTVLRRGATFKSSIVYRFSATKG